MIAVLNELFSILIFQTRYIIDNLIILASLILEESILILITPIGFIAIISLIIFLECLVAESIIKDLKTINLKRNTLNISKNIAIN